MGTHILECHLSSRMSAANRYKIRKNWTKLIDIDMGVRTLINDCIEDGILDQADYEHLYSEEKLGTIHRHSEVGEKNLTWTDTKRATYVLFQIQLKGDEAMDTLLKSLEKFSPHLKEELENTEVPVDVEDYYKVNGCSIDTDETALKGFADGGQQGDNKSISVNPTTSQISKDCEVLYACHDSHVPAPPIQSNSWYPEEYIQTLADMQFDSRVQLVRVTSEQPVNGISSVIQRVMKNIKERLSTDQNTPKTFVLYLSLNKEDDAETLADTLYTKLTGKKYQDEPQTLPATRLLLEQIEQTRNCGLILALDQMENVIGRDTAPNTLQIEPDDERRYAIKMLLISIRKANQNAHFLIGTRMGFSINDGYFDIQPENKITLELSQKVAVEILTGFMTKEECNELEDRIRNPFIARSIEVSLKEGTAKYGLNTTDAISIIKDAGQNCLLVDDAIIDKDSQMRVLKSWQREWESLNTNQEIVLSLYALAPEGRFSLTDCQQVFGDMDEANLKLKVRRAIDRNFVKLVNTEQHNSTLFYQFVPDALNFLEQLMKTDPSSRDFVIQTRKTLGSHISC